MLVRQAPSRLPTLQGTVEGPSERSSGSEVLLGGLSQAIHDIGIDEPLREVLGVGQFLHVFAAPLGEGADEVERGMSRDVHGHHVTILTGYGTDDNVTS